MTGDTNDKPMALVEKFRSMDNMKPYRTKEQKKLAREKAYKGKDGAWHSNVDVSYHGVGSGKKKQDGGE
jgi:hypothetical protein